MVFGISVSSAIKMEGKSQFKGFIGLISACLRHCYVIGQALVTAKIFLITRKSWKGSVHQRLENGVGEKSAAAKNFSSVAEYCDTET